MVVGPVRRETPDGNPDLVEKIREGGGVVPATRRKFVSRHPNALVDTSPNMASTPEVYERIFKGVGARKIMWGTDWPFSKMNSWRVIQDGCDFLSQQEKELMISGNALRFVQGQV